MESAVIRPGWLFCVIVPVVWTVTCAAGFHFPGDEYGLWGVASLPGLWLPVALGVGNIDNVMWLTLAAGGCVMAMLGAIVDRLRSPLTIWYALWVLSAGMFCWLTLRDYSSWPQAIAKNGSFLAYALSSLNMGLLLATILTLTGTAVWRIAGRVRRASGKRCGPRQFVPIPPISIP